MLALQKTFEGMPIMSLQSGGRLGELGAPIIDPRKLQITAFYAEGSRIHEISVLHTSDIREVGPLGVIVNDADQVMTAEDGLVRLQEVIDLNFSLIGKLVIDDTKRKIGKVTDYTIETDGFTIQKLHVSQSIMKNIASSGLIIGRAQIVKVTDKEIIVRSAAVPESTGLAQLVNPFRRTKGSLAAE